MTMHENVSGTWKEIQRAHVNVSGTWKEITDGWVNVSGVWKRIFAGGVDSLLTYGASGLGDTGFRAWGVGSTHYGSLSPTSVEGETVVEVKTSVGGELSIRISGTGVAQSHFRGIECSLGTFLTASATYSSNDGNGNTQWTWSAGGSFSSSGSETVRFLL